MHYARMKLSSIHSRKNAVHPIGPVVISLEIRGNGLPCALILCDGILLWSREAAAADVRLSTKVALPETSPAGSGGWTLQCCCNARESGPSLGTAAAVVLEGPEYF